MYLQNGDLENWISNVMANSLIPLSSGYPRDSVGCVHGSLIDDSKEENNITDLGKSKMWIGRSEYQAHTPHLTNGLFLPQTPMYQMRSEIQNIS